MLAIELFSGAGGLSLGLEWAGIKSVVSNEIERDFSKRFHGGKGSKNLQIGNAVPPALAQALGERIAASK